jgi:flagellar biosynthesis protein FlhB
MAESAADKTEQPTAKRLEQARRRGQVARSRELSAAVGMAAAVGALVTTAERSWAELAVLVREGIRAAVMGGDFTSTLVAGTESAALGAVGILVAPVGAVLVGGVVLGALQTGGLLAWGPIMPDLSRVAPKRERVVSVSAFVELLKGTVIVVLVGAVVWTTLEPWLGVLPRLAGARPGVIASVVGRLCESLAVRFVIATLAVGLADYLWQRHKLGRELRMSREEVKHEHKESEGDPHHKAERHRLYKELSQQRALAEVRKADFVVVNPDHVAVALRYDRDGHGAPTVVASGENLMAERIKDIAREAGVPIFRDVTLARSLKDIPEGDEIPEALYEAVAEILRAVYGMTAPAPGLPAPPAPAAPAAETSRAPGDHWRRA